MLGPRRGRRVARLTAGVLAVALALGACGGDDDDDVAADDGADSAATSAPAPREVSGGEAAGPAEEGIDGVEAFEIDSTEHTEDDLAYSRTPPAGGEHHPVPGTCGFYGPDQGADELPPEELLVHDLEHGAIWVAYDPAVDAVALDALRELVTEETKVVVTPVDGLDAPIVATAWARQLPLDAVNDPRLSEFVDAYRAGGEAPEPDAACQGAGAPEVPGAPS